MDTHTFGTALADAVARYNEHDTAARAAATAPERKRAGDRRRRALHTLGTLADAVRPADGASLSGGYRRALDVARAALPPAARAVLDGLPVEDVREWHPFAVYRCPGCDHVGHALEDFGARLDVMPYPTDRYATDRAAWLASDLPARQLARIAAAVPYPHPTRAGYSYALAPYRQSRCYTCRADAARASKGVSHE
jgi:hypothetical protein